DRIGHIVEAAMPAWLARLRSRTPSPAVANEFQEYLNHKPAGNTQNLSEHLEQANKALYGPLYQSPNPAGVVTRARNDIAEQAKEGGELLGSKWGMEEPAGNLGSMRSFQRPTPFFLHKIPVLGPIAQRLAQQNQKIYAELSAPKTLTRGVFQVEC